MVKTDSVNRQACLYCHLGLISFPDAMEYEHRLVTLRYEEKVPDTLLIFEHPPTITMGKFGDKSNILASGEELDLKGIAYYDSDRGGDATYNCPGQLVIHPIVNLRLRGARAYIHDLEQMVLDVLHGYGVAGERSPQHPGIWVGDRQIGAVGLRYSHGISMHGFSLNINPDLDSFRVINLCGLPGRSATSIAQELGKEVPTDEVAARVREAFRRIFNVELRRVSMAELTAICTRSELPERSNLVG